MAGGAGSVGGSGGMGQQPMGNAGAQPGGGGVPSFAQPYLSNLGGGGANSYNSGAPQQSTTPSNPGAAMGMLFGGGSPFGMQQQQPYGMQPMQNPFGGQQLGPNQSPGYGAAEFQQQQSNQPKSFEQYRTMLRQGPQQQVLRTPEQQLQQDQQAYQNYRNNFGQQQGQQLQNPNGPSQPTPMQMPQPGSQTPSWAGGYLGQQQMPQPMGQRPAYMDNPDFQAYQKQEQDLGRQMNEYMQKAPMFQQLQDLQGKMRGFQQPQQGQMGDTGFRAMPAVMPQQPDPGMMGEMGLFTPETYGGRGGYGGGYGGGRGGYGRQMPQPPGSESVADNRMGMPDYGRGSMDMPSPENVAPEIGIGDFMQRQFPAPRMGGGFGRRGMGGGYGGRMGGGYGGQMGGLQGLASILQGRRGGF